MTQTAQVCKKWPTCDGFCPLRPLCVAVQPQNADLRRSAARPATLWPATSDVPWPDLRHFGPQPATFRGQTCDTLARNQRRSAARPATLRPATSDVPWPDLRHFGPQPATFHGQTCDTLARNQRRSVARPATLWPATSDVPRPDLRRSQCGVPAGGICLHKNDCFCVASGPKGFWLRKNPHFCVTPWPQLLDQVQRYPGPRPNMRRTRSKDTPDQNQTYAGPRPHTLTRSHRRSMTQTSQVCKKWPICDGFCPLRPLCVAVQPQNADLRHFGPQPATFRGQTCDRARAEYLPGHLFTQKWLFLCSQRPKRLLVTQKPAFLRNAVASSTGPGPNMRWTRSKDTLDQDQTYAGPGPKTPWTKTKHALDQVQRYTAVPPIHLKCFWGRFFVLAASKMAFGAEKYKPPVQKITI